MNTNSKKTYQQPFVERVVLDSAISLTLDSSSTPMGDPEAMFLNTESLTSEPSGFQVL
jgi:hypothetical protein